MDENEKKLGTEEEIEEEEKQDETSKTGSNDSATDNTDTGKKKERSFTQTQVNRMMTREKNQGRSAAYREMGIDPNDTRMVKMFQAFVNSQKTDEQKQAEKATELEKKQAEAEHRIMVAEAKAEAMMIGVKSQYVEDAVTLALSKMSDDTDLKTILSELKGKYSVWFKDDDPEDNKEKEKEKEKTGKKGTGSPLKENSKKKEETKGSMGTRLAAMRNKGERKSCWGQR